MRWSGTVWWALAVAGALLYGAAFAEKPPAGPGIVGFDKVAHFFVYGLLGTLFFRSQRGAFLGRRRWLAAFGATMAVGVADELLQAMNPNRSFGVDDWVADAAGAALAVTLYRSWGWYRRLLEWRVWGRKGKGG